LIAQGAELDVEPVDRVAFFAELRKLAGIRGLEVLDVYLETWRR